MNPGDINDRNMELVPADSRDITRQKAVNCVNCGAVFNRDKVFCPACGLSAQDSYLPEEQVYTAELGTHRANRSARIFALLSLMLGIAGPVALGIGWLLAIIFGFTALNLIRSRGGMPGDRKLAVWGIVLGFLWPAAVFAGLIFHTHRTATGRNIARNEAAVKEVLAGAAVAQRYIKSGFFITGPDSRASYAGLDEIRAIEQPFSLPGEEEVEGIGYMVRAAAVRPDGFEIIAHPLNHGVTGKRSFFIDETGILRGGDVGGDPDFRRWGTLPGLTENPVFEDYRNEIASSLSTLADRLVREAEFERARKILYEIRSNYEMTPAARDAQGQIEHLDRRVYEHRAESGFRNTVSLIEEGDYRAALTRLKGLREEFPEASIIREVESRISEVERLLADTLEAEAAALFSEARELEAGGQYDKAVSVYRKIERELDSTSYFERAGSMVKAIEKRKAEEEAEKMFSEIAAMSIGDSFAQIIRNCNTLLRHYSGTDFVKSNEARLRTILNSAVGERESRNAESAFENENFNAAIQAGEAALKADPSLGERVSPILEESYRRIAEGFFHGGAFSRAVEYYQGWLRLADHEGTEEYGNYLESLYRVAVEAYYAGEFEKMKTNRELFHKHFHADAEFWYVMGSILAAEKNYSEAFSHFRNAVSIDETNARAWLKKAFCRVLLMVQMEEELAELLKQITPLTRGTDFVFRVNSLVSGLHAKDLEIRRVAAGTSQREADIRRRAQLPAERAEFASETRVRMFALEDAAAKNDALRNRINSSVSRISRMYSGVNANLRMASFHGTEHAEFRRLFLIKAQEAAGYSRIVSALNQEGTLESNAIFALRQALSKYSQHQPFDEELRDMRRLTEGTGRMRMKTELEEGMESLNKSLAAKIPVEEYFKSIR